ncbi:porphobilinogen synthase [Candidatus Lucifugimonas marina]|uniref:Delta-aminolevulinic acid dehydratase n=1 Tax=Candidatus Lucifugimonas marina TaxID=3038979 RepID=A0AAJ5ZJR3_9CHLR|nr:porphobilinogen synthase [SAR202 cluster bacterium JH702]MDG0870368.1 porphobilinogen synthase [SAR202 cluster bacterium JH639]WFG36076.1 porphobilinogen synthase [SAR202 cluster bacterium JH545]WFG40021.1 porphobilinogen synthase [SAR202 cluster bacterium JH1073]
MTSDQYPHLRRLRRNATLRDMLNENRLAASEFIYPMFVVNGSGVRTPIEPMPGIDQISLDIAVEEAQRAMEAGVKSVLLFGIPDEKDATGSGASSPDEAVQRAVQAIKKASPETYVITDVCLCEYTDHGHCGIINGNDVDNDATLPLLAQTAVSHADAGADMVAPSAMMDGQVAAIRAGLNEAGFSDTPVMGYSAKYASAFYGPFRIAADSAPQFGDRRAYQMAPNQGREAMREVEADLDEGADIIMVKPALAYLDVIKEASMRFDTPLAAYNVSGEYSMIAAAGQAGWLDRERAMMEVLTSIKRAGADLIITYSAIEAAEIIAKG